MSIDWMSLVKVALVSFAFGVGIVAAFSVGIVGVGKASPGRSSASDDHDHVSFGAAPSGASKAGLALAVVSFTACAAAVLYGLWLIIPQFH